MRRLSKVTSLFLLAFTACSLAACGSAPDDEETSTSAEGEIRKRVKPKGGNGAFELLKPTWNPAGAMGSYVFDNKSIAVGSRVEKVPGNWWFRLASQGFSGGMTIGDTMGQVPIVKGQIEERSATGLRVRFSQAPYMGKSAYWRLKHESPTATAGYLYGGDGDWWKTGVLLFVPPGKVSIKSDLDIDAVEVDTQPGKLTELVLPTTKVSVEVDSYDPDYPTPTGCGSTPYVAAGPSNTEEREAVRSASGAGVTDLVVPHGTRASVRLNTYGIVSEKPTVANGKVSFLLNRLEVDDVEVTYQEDGSTQLVRGTYYVEVKEGASYRLLQCGAFKTHTGIDLPDGTYRITAAADAESGRVQHIEEVSFP